MYEEEIRKSLNSEKLLIGKDEVLKNVRKGLVAKVYTASNCPNDVLVDLQKYSTMAGFELLNTKVLNHELGAVCKKPFSIAVIGLKK
ncbi:MAG: ribosomal L7Ae/L30e/S12e/Gadd45 family protein [Candidatus Woesearchaeota archaeon]